MRWSGSRTEIWVNTRRLRRTDLLTGVSSGVPREVGPTGSHDLSVRLCCINLFGCSLARCFFCQAATEKMSNSLFINGTSSLTLGLQVRQCPRRIMRITSKPLMVAAAVFIV